MHICCRESISIPEEHNYESTSSNNSRCLKGCWNMMQPHLILTGGRDALLVRAQ
jgi:hypothetical protein